MREPVLVEYSEEHYLTWESEQKTKFELHHGFVFAFAGGSLRHDLISENVKAALREALPEPCKVFGSDAKLRLAERMFYYPDATVVCDDVPLDALYNVDARIVAEVLSASTRAYDVVEKRAAYRRLPSVQAYVIVHTDTQRIEVDGREHDVWVTRIYDADEAFVCGQAIALSAMYAQT